MVTANSTLSPFTNPSNSHNPSNTVRIFLAGALIFVTLIANICLLHILWIVKSVRVIKNDGCGYYVINLCIIDVLASLICIMCTALYKFNKSCEQFTIFWKIFSSLQILLSSGWIATVAVMIMERLGVTKNPLLKRATFRRMKIRLMLAWFWAICNSSPQLFLRQYINVDIHVECDHPSQQQSNKFVFPVIRMVSIFVIPSILILFSTIGVFTHSFTSENALSLKRKKGHQRLAYLVFVLWVTFLVSNFPKHVLELAYVYNRNRVVVKEDGYHREQTFMYILVFSWSIYLITPVVYFALYKRILKHELKKSSGATFIYLVCFRWKSEISNSQRNRNKTPCKNTLKCSEDADVDSSDYRYLLQNLGVMEPSTTIKGSSIKEDSANVPSANEADNKDGTLTSRIRKISQPLLKKKSTANSLDHNVDPYLLPSNEHTLHTLNQKTPLLERQERVGTPPRRKTTLPLL